MIYPFVAESSHRDVGDSGTVEMEVEKKREQNRLAQRKYRNKMRQKIAELERQVGTQNRRLSGSHASDRFAPWRIGSPTTSSSQPESVPSSSSTGTTPSSVASIAGGQKSEIPRALAEFMGEFLKRLEFHKLDNSNGSSNLENESVRSQRPRARSGSYNNRNGDEVWPPDSHKRHVEAGDIVTPPVTAHTLLQNQNVRETVAADNLDNLGPDLDSQWSQYLSPEQFSLATAPPCAPNPCSQTAEDWRARLSMAEKVADLLHCILAHGFDSFEDLILAYYNIPFLASVDLPHLYNRESRTKELPDLISKLLRQTLREQSTNL